MNKETRHCVNLISLFVTILLLGGMFLISTHLLTSVVTADESEDLFYDDFSGEELNKSKWTEFWGSPTRTLKDGILSFLGGDILGWEKFGLGTFSIRLRTDRPLDKGWIWLIADADTIGFWIYSNKAMVRVGGKNQQDKYFDNDWTKWHTYKIVREENKTTVFVDEIENLTFNNVQNFTLARIGFGCGGGDQTIYVDWVKFESERKKTTKAEINSQANKLFQEAKDIQRQIKDAEHKGYAIFYAKQLCEEAIGLIERALKDEQSEEEVLLSNTEELLMRAKANWVTIKLPRWTKEHYARLTCVPLEIPLEGLNVPRYRQIVSNLSPFVNTFILDGWADAGGGNGQNRGLENDLASFIDECHNRGLHFRSYIESMLFPRGYPPEEFPNGEEWQMLMKDGRPSTEYSRGIYHLHLCKNNPGWQNYSIDRMRFAARVGIDCVFYDSTNERECFCKICQETGKTPQQVSEEVISRSINALKEVNPEVVLCPNNKEFRSLNVFEDGVFFMHEYGFGYSPHEAYARDYNALQKWHHYVTKAAPEWTKLVRGMPRLGWAFGAPTEPFWENIYYATFRINKTSPFFENPQPSGEWFEFSHRFCDYIYGDFVSLFTPQDIVTIENRPETLGNIIRERVLPDGSSELVLHLLNLNESKVPFQDISVKVDLSKTNLVMPFRLTLCSVEGEIQGIDYKLQGKTLYFIIPQIKSWSFAVIGHTLYPQVNLGIKDREIISGERLEVKAVIKNLIAERVDGTLKLLLPEGWTCDQEKKEYQIDKAKEETISFTVGVPSSTKEGVYAITPLLSQGKIEIPSFPLQLVVTKGIKFKINPPWADSPTPPGKKVSYILKIKNNFQRRVMGEISFKLPSDWKIDKASIPIDLSPDEEKGYPIYLQVPDRGLKIWEYKDEEIIISFYAKELSIKESYPIRISSPHVFAIYVTSEKDRPSNVMYRLNYAIEEIGPPGIRVEIYSKESQLAEKTASFSLPKGMEVEVELQPVKRAIERARYLADQGHYVVLWFRSYLTGETRIEEYTSELQELLHMGVGLILQEDILEDNPLFSKSNICPVDFVEKSRTKGLKILQNHPITSDLPKYDFSQDFTCSQVKIKDWGETIAVWGDNSPAIVVSKDPNRRVIYIGSFLDLPKEESWFFWPWAHGSLGGLEKGKLIPFYRNLIRWAAIGDLLGKGYKRELSKELKP